MYPRAPQAREAAVNFSPAGQHTLANHQEWATIRKSLDDDGEHVVQIWCRAGDAALRFLNREDRRRTNDNAVRVLWRLRERFTREIPQLRHDVILSCEISTTDCRLDVKSTLV